MADASRVLPNTDQTEEAAPVSVSDESVKPWPFIDAFIASWICPATTARHLAHVGLLRAFLFHIACGVGLCVGGVLVVAAIEQTPLEEIWRGLRSEVARDPEGFFTPLAIVAGIVEASAIGIALLVVPWGARDEKLRTSLYQGVRAVWLQSAQVALAALLQLAFVLWSFRFAFELFPTWNTRPWYSRHLGDIFIFASFLLFGWAFWGLLRAVGSRRIQPPAMPPTCQVCGYNLTATAGEGVCPECGEPVSASVGRDARVGIDWERKGRLGLRPSWWNTAWPAIRDPGRFCRDLQVYTPPGDHRRFLLINMVLTGMLGVLSAVLWLLGFVAGPGPYMDMWEDWIWLTAPMSGMLTGLSVLAFSLLFAGLLGFAFSLSTRRNVLPAAMRCAAYLSGFFVFWAIINLPVAWIYGFHRDLVRPLAEWLQLGDEAVAIAFWSGFNLIFLCKYLRLLQVSIASARFANR